MSESEADERYLSPQKFEKIDYSGIESESEFYRIELRSHTTRLDLC
jgi:hypothetical protein